MSVNRAVYDTSLAHNRSLIVLARYLSGVGIKPIAKEFGAAGVTIAKILNDFGQDTSKRRNYPAKKPKANARGNYYQRVLRGKFSTTIEKRIRHRLWLAGSGVSVNRKGVFRFVGCSSEILRKHLESKFKKGMTWENYGEWHIDHIVPCASFDLSDENQVAQCFNWQNLRPLWARDNISKGAKITDGQVPLPIAI